MRVFSSGAVRSSNKGKPEFYGYRHPLVERSFGEYMLRHQTQEDGKQRDAWNWWSGWDKEISLQSLIRHLEDLTALHAGYKVFKLRHKKGLDGEKTIYLQPKEELLVSDYQNIENVSEEDCLNAIRFNAGAYLLEVLKNNEKRI